MSTTHSPNHLKPGQPMQHDDHGVGIVTNTYISGLGIHYATYTGHAGLTRDFTGWKPLETCTWQERQWLDYRGGVECICDTNPATTDGPSEECEIHGRRYSEWVERATEAEKEQELTDVVKPGHVQVRVDDLEDMNYPYNVLERRGRLAWYAWADQQQPAQPDEPQEFGAKVTLTAGDFKSKWLRSGIAPRPFVNLYGARSSWNELTQHGQVSLGWDDAQ